MYPVDVTSNSTSRPELHQRQPPAATTSSSTPATTGCWRSTGSATPSTGRSAGSRATTLWPAARPGSLPGPVQRRPGGGVRLRDRRRLRRRHRQQPGPGLQLLPHLGLQLPDPVRQQGHRGRPSSTWPTGSPSTRSTAGSTSPTAAGQVEKFSIGASGSRPTYTYLTSFGAGTLNQPRQVEVAPNGDVLVTNRPPNKKHNYYLRLQQRSATLEFGFGVTGSGQRRVHQRPARGRGQRGRQHGLRHRLGRQPGRGVHPHPERRPLHLGSLVLHHPQPRGRAASPSSASAA